MTFIVLIYLNIKSQVGIYKIILNSGFAKKHPPTPSLSTSPWVFSLSDFHNLNTIRATFTLLPLGFSHSAMCSSLSQSLSLMPSPDSLP